MNEYGRQNNTVMRNDFSVNFHLSKLLPNSCERLKEKIEVDHSWLETSFFNPNPEKAQGDQKRSLFCTARLSEQVFIKWTVGKFYYKEL